MKFEIWSREIVKNLINVSLNCTTYNVRFVFGFDRSSFNEKKGGGRERESLFKNKERYYGKSEKKKNKVRPKN